MYTHTHVCYMLHVNTHVHTQTMQIGAKEAKGALASFKVLCEAGR
jgi:hypothetical protein